MPELPEVETTRQGLKPHLLQHTIAGVTVRHTQLRQPIPANLKAQLTGQTVTAIRRRAKYILVDLTNGITLLIHLGMSGRLVVEPADKPLAKHDHIILHMPNGIDIRFNDARRFGLVLLHPTTEERNHPLLINLGPEPLEQTFTPAYLHQTLRQRSSPIKTTLMNNALVVGVGNIYANEALFRAGILPTRPAKSLSKKESLALHTAIVTVLTEAISAGGTTLRDYVQTDGTLGNFHENFAVYNRHTQPCFSCQTPIEKKTIGQRSTWFCPHCQR